MPRKGEMIWTLDQIAKLREGYGKRSATLLAREIGCGRNAIFGKAYRLGLCKKERGWKPQLCAPRPVRARIPKEIKMAKRSNEPERQPPKELPLDCWQPLPGRRPVAIYHLQADDCRWPVQGGFCGCQRGPGPYCSVHAIIARVGMAGVNTATAS